MLERANVEQYTASKQELQIVVETLFDEMMARFDLSAFLAAPRDYTRAVLAVGARDAIEAVAGDAYRIGQSLAVKSRE
jgi:hypothetical protein